MSVCMYSCLGYPECNAHAPYYIVICGLSVSTIFLHIISQTARFSGKNCIECKMCVLTYLQLLSETFLIIGRIRRDLITNVPRQSYKVPAILVRL
jgi:hypothetical protein